MTTEPASDLPDPQPIPAQKRRSNKLAIAVILLAVVVALAVGASIYTFGFRSTQPSYSGYEPVLHEWYALSRYDVAKIKHLHGPFYAIRYRSRSHPGKQYCVLVDVSTEYKEAPSDRFWTANGPFPDVERNICDF
jgi:hypothetical protein